MALVIWSELFFALGYVVNAMVLRRELQLQMQMQLLQLLQLLEWERQSLAAKPMEKTAKTLKLDYFSYIFMNKRLFSFATVWLALRSGSRTVPQLVFAFANKNYFFMRATFNINVISFSVSHTHTDTFHVKSAQRTRETIVAHLRARAYTERNKCAWVCACVWVYIRSDCT